VPPAALRAFCDRIGVAKRDNVVDVSLLDYYIREDLNRSARRVMVVLQPLRVVLDNYPEGKVEEVEAVNNPEDSAAGVRRLPFSRVLYIERDDFRTSAPKKYFRLAPGREVRLKHAYLIRCERVVEDERGEPIELHCTYDPESRGGEAADGRRVPGTLHWVAAATAVPAEVRLYDHLFNTPDPAAAIQASGLAAALNPASLVVLDGCRAEPGLSGARAGDHFQFLRQGYFCVDPETTAGGPVFNRTLPLRDSWAKIEKREPAPDKR
jgi:glutaminyl-tRNA synthetase